MADDELRWKHDHSRPLLSFPQVPDAFVRLGPDAFGAVTADGQIEVTQPMPAGLDFERNEIAIRISREMALDFGLIEPTDAERTERAAHSERIRVETATRRAQPGPALTLEAVLELLGWPAGFAEHLLHPACYCGVTMTDDPYLCSWATELGWEWSWRVSRVVRRRPEVCPDCAELTCDDDCPTAAANGWPTEKDRR